MDSIRFSRTGSHRAPFAYAVLALATLVLGSAAGSALAASHISGRVTDVAGTPLAGAIVLATYRGIDDQTGEFPPDGSFEAEARTDSDGRYDLVLEFPGCYFLRFSAEGHQSAFFATDEGPWNARCVEVAEDAEIAGIDARLEPAGAIRGRVTDARSGAPVEGAYVSVWPARWDPTDPDDDDVHGDGQPGGGHPGDDPGMPWGEGFAMTDADGRYRVGGLAAGEYLLHVYADAHLPSFYGAAQDPEHATRIVVDPPEITEGIDVALSRGGCISGQVRDGTGAPIEGAYVSIGGPEMPVDGGGQIDPTTLPDGNQDRVTGADGRYRLCGLPPGEYRVWVHAEGYLHGFYGDASCWQDASLVAVPADGDIAGIDIVLSRGGRIEGRVTADGARLEGAWVQAWPVRDDAAEPGDPETCWDRGGGASPVDERGAYAIAGLASGSYLVVAEAPDHLRTFYGGGQDPRQAQAVVVRAPDAARAIDISLERGGTITGTVADETSGAPLKAWVELYLPGMEGGSDPADGIRSHGAATDERGVYRITGVPSGDYLILASVWEQSYESEFYPDARTPEAASPVTVRAPEETAGIDFRLSPTAPADGTISGRVTTAEDRAPVARAVVTAISLAGTAGFAVSDEEGFYRIPSLVAGEYIVLAASVGRIGSFYDRAVSWETATRVRVAGRVAGIDFVLAELADGDLTISGRVVGPDGEGVAQVWVYAEPESSPTDGDDDGDDDDDVDGAVDDDGEANGATGVRSFTTTGSDGRYVLSNLLPGRYRVRATHPNSDDSFHADPGEELSVVSIERGSVEGIDIVLGAAAPLPGSPASPVTFESSAPNPFRGSVELRFVVDRSGVPLSVELFDPSGRRVRSVQGKSEGAGRQRLVWDGKDDGGALLPSGVYLFRAEANGQTRSGRVVLLR